jgi:hypothetical protein
LTGAFGSGRQNDDAVLGLLAHFPLESRRLAIRADATAHYDHGGCAPAVCGPGFMVSGGAALFVRLNDPATRWSPYAVAGAELFYETPTSDIGVRGSHLGFQSGVGFEFRPHVHTYFVETRYLGMSPGGLVQFAVGLRF